MGIGGTLFLGAGPGKLALPSPLMLFAAVVSESKKVAPEPATLIRSFEWTGPRIWSLLANWIAPSMLVK
jgi:hypothetical protein